MIDVDKAIATAVKTGKVIFGTSEAVKSVKAGKARLIVVASNSPSNVRGDLEYYAKLSQIPIVAYRGNSFDLGMICGKPFAVAALTVKEPGDSDILKLAEKPEAEPEEIEETEES
jgi:large subunit ribosomal protein L30e